jgi:hypothetical protein
MKSFVYIALLSIPIYLYHTIKKQKKIKQPVISEKMVEPMYNMCTIDKVYYYMNVLSKDDYNKIYNECIKLNPELMEETMEDSKLAKRRILNVSKDSVLYDIFYGEVFINYLNNKLNMKLKPSKLLPIDYRIYELGGRMKWHRDVIIAENKKCPQIEIVFTLDNTSDSRTIWKEDDTGDIHKIRTEANSILITQGNSAYHKVLPVTTGQRRIIKIAYEVI